MNSSFYNMSNTVIKLCLLFLLCGSTILSVGQDTTQLVVRDTVIPNFKLRFDRTEIIRSERFNEECPYNINMAKKAIESNQLSIVIHGGIIGFPEANEKNKEKFLKKYNVQFDYLGCIRMWDVMEEDPHGYNETILEHLSKTVDKNVRKELEQIWK